MGPACGLPEDTGSSIACYCGWCALVRAAPTVAAVQRALLVDILKCGDRCLQLLRAFIHLQGDLDARGLKSLTGQIDAEVVKECQAKFHHQVISFSRDALATLVKLIDAVVIAGERKMRIPQIYEFFQLAPSFYSKSDYLNKLIKECLENMDKFFSEHAVFLANRDRAVQVCRVF